jgi:hypothetical protein
MSRRAQSLSFRAKQKGGMSLSPGGSMHGTINLIDVDARWEQLEATIIHLSGANLAAAASTPPADGPLPYYTEWRELRGIDTDLAWPLKNKHRSWDLLPETPRAGGKLHEVDTAFNAHRYRDSSILYLRCDLIESLCPVCTVLTRSIAYVAYRVSLSWPGCTQGERRRRFRLGSEEY